MSEHRLIDVNKLKLNYAWWQNVLQRDFNTIVDIQPTVDAVPVVRCKDCKWFDIEHLNRENYCRQWADLLNPNDFCSYGERRNKE